MEYKIFLNGEYYSSIEARNASGAAKKMAKKSHADLDYFNDIELVVLGEDGTKFKYFVEVQSDPMFLAAEVLFPKDEYDTYDYEM